MSAISCYKRTCNNEIEASCSCTSHPTFSCKQHLTEHFQSAIKPHNVSPFFLKPVENTKKSMLNFLREQKTKNDAIKKEMLTSFSHNIYKLENIFKTILKEIDSDSTKFVSYFDKIWETEKVSRLEKDPVLNLLILQSDKAIEEANIFFTSNENFELWKNTITVIDQVISSFIEEKTKTTQSDEILKLENNELNFDKEPENIQHALNEYKEMIKANSKDADAYSGIGIVFYNERRFEEAIKHYDNAIKINPNVADYQANKGNALMGLGRRDDAMECYKKAIEINPNQENAYNGIGCIFLGEKRYEKAIKYIDDAIRINPNYANYYSNKGNALYDLGRREEAMECFQQAIRIDPNDDNAYNGMGNIYYDDKNYREALNFYSYASIINPISAIYYSNKGDAFKKLGKIEDAEYCFNMARYFQ